MATYKTRRGARNYGIAVGILQLDCSLPFIPGDVDNADTYDFPVIYKVVPVKVQSSAFQDFIQDESGFGSIKSVQQIEQEVLAKAKELDIPVRKENLTVKRTREYILIEAHYEITVDFFNGSYKYVWKFDPVAQRPIFNV